MLMGYNNKNFGKLSLLKFNTLTNYVNPIYEQISFLLNTYRNFMYVVI